MSDSIFELVEFEEMDPWAQAECMVERMAYEARQVAERETEAHQAIAYAVFRVKAARAITELLERIRELEEHLEGGLS